MLPVSVPAVGLSSVRSWRYSAPSATPSGPPGSWPNSRVALKSIWAMRVSALLLMVGDSAAYRAGELRPAFSAMRQMLPAGRAA